MLSNIYSELEDNTVKKNKVGQVNRKCWKEAVPEKGPEGGEGVSM